MTAVPGAAEQHQKEESSAEFWTREFDDDLGE